MKAPLPAATAATDQDDPTIWRVDGAWWAELEPVRKLDNPRQNPGRPRRGNRAIVDGLLRLDCTGSQWAARPSGFGPESTGHRRFTEWVATGARERAWAVVRRASDDELGRDRTWRAAGGGIVQAPFGQTGGPARRTPPDATPPTAANPAPSATCGPRGRASRGPWSAPAPTAATGRSWRLSWMPRWSSRRQRPRRPRCWTAATIPQAVGTRRWHTAPRRLSRPRPARPPRRRRRGLPIAISLAAGWSR